MTNNVYLVTVIQEGVKSQIIFKRKIENRRMKVLTAYEDDVRAYMHQVGYGPQKYYEDTQILIEECYSGKPMVFSEIRNFKLLQKLMPVFAEFHTKLSGIPCMNSKTIFAQTLDKGIMKRIKNHLEYCKKLHHSHF